MTPALRRFPCPTCGALLQEDATRGAVRCAFCGRRAALLAGARTVPRSVLEPAVDRSEALLALRRALADEGVLPRSLRRRMEPVDARLVFVPFHTASGLRVGVVERLFEREMSFEATYTAKGAHILRAVEKPVEPKDDRARVVINDVERSAPAVRRPGWGLESLAPGALVAQGAVLRTFEPERVPADAAVLAADADPEELVGRLRGEVGRGETTLIDPAVRTVLVPVWRVRFRVQGGLYDATVDAVQGRLLAARVPEDDRRRVSIAVAYLGMASLLLGLVLRLLGAMGGVPDESSGEALGLFLLAVLCVVGLFATYAWNVVRYDAERVYEAGEVRAEYLNRPAPGGLARFWEKTFGKGGSR